MRARPGPRALIGVFGCAFLLVAQTAFWSWKTSGVLQAVQDWQRYPWGYVAETTMPIVGTWPLAKENFIYVQHHQAFLNVADQYVRPTSGFEHLNAGLWFLGPIASGIVLNVVLWALACLSAGYVARRLFPDTPSAPWVAALLCLCGQGFLHSVGEVSPHVLGYGVGFWIGAYAVTKQLWRGDASRTDHWLVHGLLGVLKLGYEAAWFSFPFLMLLSYRSVARRRHRLLSWEIAGFLASCAIFSLGPGLLMILLSKPFGARDSVSNAVLLVQQRPLVDLIVAYLIALADSVLAFGPFVLALLVVGIIAVVGDRDRYALAGLATTAAMLAITAVVLLPYPARGYSTFGLALPLFLVATRGYAWVWERRSVWRYAAPALLASCFLWANAPLIGWRLPLAGFSWGYIHTASAGHWQAFEIVRLR